jgi:selenocysteine lyase/cysteine desulfurase
MTSIVQNRRAFLSTIAAGAAGGFLTKAVSPSTAANAAALPSPASEFLITNGVTYLNTGALGPCRRETIEESMKAWEILQTQPTKFYGLMDAKPLAEKTRTTAAKFLGCDLSEIAITTSTTNGMNAVAQGLHLKAGDRILATDQEHGGGLHCWEYYQKYYGVEVDKVAIPRGEFDAASILKRIEQATRKETKLITVSHVFSSTGARMPIADISALARSKGILCIVDGAQAVGAIKVNVKELGCHAYATSGHKWLMGPKGTGLLYISKDAQSVIRPMQLEKNYNTYTDGTGVVNLPCILGLGKAIEYLDTVGIDKVEKHNLAIRDRLYNALRDVPNMTIVSPPPGKLSSPMLALLLAEKFPRQKFVTMLLEKHNIAIRPTHPEFGFNGIRFSMHLFNNEKEIDRLAQVLRQELAA